MTKEEFRQELEGRLHGIPQTDLEERVSYYLEKIDARMEEGSSEETAIAELGPVDAVVDGIMTEIPLTKLVQHKVTPQQNRNMVWIVLLILCFPLWFPLLVAALSVAFSLYIACWAITIAFYAVVLALGIGSVACLPIAGMYLAGGHVPAGGLFIGAALVLAGLTILFLLASNGIAKGLIKLTGMIVMGIKRAFMGKRKEVVS